MPVYIQLQSWECEDGGFRTPLTPWRISGYFMPETSVLVVNQYPVMGIVCE